MKTTLSAIILSNTSTDNIYDATMVCINTLMESEDFENKFGLEIILIESNKSYNDRYSFPKEVKVIIPDDSFGFHKFLNIGIKASTGDYIALCNNDLLFHKNWFQEVYKVGNAKKDILSFSPIDPIKEIYYTQDIMFGYKIRSYVKGWCIICKKELFDEIGLLDESFLFYYSDNDYALTLLKYNIKHALITKSKVEHLHKYVSKELREKKNAFFKPEFEYKKLPKHLQLDGYKHILKDKRSLQDHLIYYNKWGRPNSIYRFSDYARKLNNFNLNFLARGLFYTKQKLHL